MKFSCLKNDFKKAIKPLEKLAAIFKQESLTLGIQVEDNVIMELNISDYRMKGRLMTAEIQEAGGIYVDYEEVQQVLKKIRRNVLLSFRMIPQPEGLKLAIVTPEGEIFTLGAEPMNTTQIISETQPILNVSMDEFWPAILQMSRVVPKKHVVESFTKLKWVVSASDNRLVAINQTELAIQHFQSLIAESSQIFYLSVTILDHFKKCLSGISDARLMIETEESRLKISGESVEFWLPIERRPDLPIEKLITRQVQKYPFSLTAWKEHIDQAIDREIEIGSGLTPKEMMYQPQIIENNLQLIRVDLGTVGGFSAQEFLKIFKQETDDQWECWLSQESAPMIAFVKKNATSTFYLYLLTTGLSV